MNGYKILFVSELSNYTGSLGDGLRQLGYEVSILTTWDEGKIASTVAEFGPDMLLTVGCKEEGAAAMPTRLPQICRRYRLIHLYWATEDKIHFDRISLPVVRRLQPDLVMTLHQDCVAQYRRYGFEAVYFNFALNPRLFPPKQSLSQEIYDLSFIGTTHLEVRTYRYRSLEQLVFPLIRAGIRTDVWGRNWQQSKKLVQREFGAVIPKEWDHGYLSFEQTADIYHRSKIMLGVQNAPDQVTQRTFEILGTGAFMIASRTEELQRLFREGEEIVLSSSADETLALVDYYLKHPKEREEIGRQGREAVLKQHTFAHRWADVWPVIQPILRAKKGG